MLCLHGDATSMSISFNLVGICRDVEEKWLFLKAVEKIGLFWREASCWHSTGVGQGWEYLDLKFKMAWPCLSRYCSNNSRALWRIAKNILHSIFKRKDFLGMKFHQRNSAIRFFLGHSSLVFTSRAERSCRRQNRNVLLPAALVL